MIYSLERNFFRSRRQSHVKTSPHTLLPPLILFSASHIHLILISCPLISSRFNFKYISFAVHPPIFLHLKTSPSSLLMLSHLLIIISFSLPYFVPISYQHIRRVRLLGCFRPPPIGGPTWGRASGWCQWATPLLLFKT